MSNTVSFKVINVISMIARKAAHPSSHRIDRTSWESWFADWSRWGRSSRCGCRPEAGRLCSAGYPSASAGTGGQCPAEQTPSHGHSSSVFLCGCHSLITQSACHSKKNKTDSCYQTGSNWIKLDQTGSKWLRSNESNITSFSSSMHTCSVVVVVVYLF